MDKNKEFDFKELEFDEWEFKEFDFKELEFDEWEFKEFDFKELEFDESIFEGDDWDQLNKDMEELQKQAKEHEKETGIKTTSFTVSRSYTSTKPIK